MFSNMCININPEIYKRVNNERQMDVSIWSCGILSFSHSSKVNVFLRYSRKGTFVSLLKAILHQICDMEEGGRETGKQKTGLV